MKSLLRFRPARAAVAAMAAVGLSASLGTGMAAAGKPDNAVERSAEAGSTADDNGRPVTSEGRKVG